MGKKKNKKMSKREQQKRNINQAYAHGAGIDWSRSPWSRLQCNSSDAARQYALSDDAQQYMLYHQMMKIGVRELFEYKGWDTQEEFLNVMKDVELTPDDYQIDFVFEGDRPTRKFNYVTESVPYEFLGLNALEYSNLITAMKQAIRKNLLLPTAITLNAYKYDSGECFISPSIVSISTNAMQKCDPHMNTSLLGYIILDDYTTGHVYPKCMFGGNDEKENETK